MSLHFEDWRIEMRKQTPYTRFEETFHLFTMAHEFKSYYLVFKKQYNCDLPDELRNKAAHDVLRNPKVMSCIENI